MLWDGDNDESRPYYLASWANCSPDREDSYGALLAESMISETVWPIIVLEDDWILRDIYIYIYIHTHVLFPCFRRYFVGICPLSWPWNLGLVNLAGISSLGLGSWNGYWTPWDLNRSISIVELLAARASWMNKLRIQPDRSNCFRPAHVRFQRDFHRKKSETKRFEDHKDDF